MDYRHRKKVTRSLQTKTLSIKQKKIKWVYVTILTLFLVFIFVLRRIEPMVFPITQINLIAPCNRISKPEIMKEIMPLVGGFFSTDVIFLKRQLLQLPFVESVAIRRIWPNTLNVSLREQSFIAKWGKHGGINLEGEVIKQVTLSEKLPLFNGPEKQAYSMVQTYYLMSDALKGTKLKITELDLNSRRSWQLILNNKMQVILGRTEILDRLNRFISVWPKLNKAYHDNISAVDLRYSNGLSIRPRLTVIGYEH